MPLQRGFFLFLTLLHGKGRKEKEEGTAKKERANKYGEKLAVEGSFADVFKVIKRTKRERKTLIKKLILDT